MVFADCTGISMELEFQQANLSSSEEEAELERSVKKFKDNLKEKPFIPPRSQVSYTDSLLGDIPGAYAQAFRFDRVKEAEVESDTELDDLVEGSKSRIRAPWTKALIKKVYGKTVGYSYLTFKINTLWKPGAKVDCVDLGKDFFLVKFSDDTDYDKVLRGGPWFLELPIEFYDSSVLREIGLAIGPLLRIDSYTASGSRASYAHLCLQIDLTKPLINTVKVGLLRLKVMYEGISSMCFYCGRIGHRQENCCHRIRPFKKADNEEPPQRQELQQAKQTEPLTLENGS
ncbi:hypothetical protein SO802_005164 [Lithocarpus litseifolius]|uniref:CCHC-type domain-containing protein n=1 Tax=Lithocarpus litseifolius TaxID=425828 RepID=A0AAW2DN17_9ROSI